MSCHVIDHRHAISHHNHRPSSINHRSSTIVHQPSLISIASVSACPLCVAPCLTPTIHAHHHHRVRNARDSDGTHDVCDALGIHAQCLGPAQPAPGDAPFCSDTTDLPSKMHAGYPPPSRAGLRRLTQRWGVRHGSCVSAVAANFLTDLPATRSSARSHACAPLARTLGARPRSNTVPRPRR